FLKLRDYGHTVLGGRKERRRFSLLGMRRYLGDYLDVGGKSAFGETLHSAAGISAETVAFSSRAEILTSKFGRSSKLTPRFVVVTDKAVYILITQLVQGSPQTSCDRKIPLVTISSVGLSNLKDDWMVINVKNSEEADPVLVVPFKTEMVVHLLQRTGGSIQIAIGPTLDYQKKKGKREQIHVSKDQMGGEDGVYKSHKLAISSGQPPSSVSKPMPKRKPGIVRPITQGKLLRPGGPSVSEMLA
ncbi:myosin tail 2, partial [Atractiella rhizophila]